MTPILPLDTFREVIGYSPFHFWQLANTKVPITDACNELVKEYAWQNTDAQGRSEIKEAIEVAEGRWREHAGYSGAPHWVEETVQYPRFYDRALDRLHYADADGRWISLRVGEGKVQAAGIESLTLLGTVTTALGGGLVFSDADGDGLNDTFTATLATTLTDTDEIAIYFASGDRLDAEDAGERWRIKPVSVKISGGNVTIRGRYWLLVKPILYQGVASDQLDPSTVSNFVSSLEIYQRRNNSQGTTLTTAQAVLIYESQPYPAFCDPVFNSNNSTDPGGVGQSIGRVNIRDGETGYVSPVAVQYNATTQQFAAVWENWRPPDRATIRYYAGEPLVNGQVNREWAVVITRLAAAEMSRRICGCEQSNRELFRWQVDLAMDMDGAASFSVSPEDLDNPLGTRAGQVYAWKRIRQLHLTPAFTF